MREKLIELEKRALQELESVESLDSLEKFRVTYLGKKGMVTQVLKDMRELSSDQKREVGRCTGPRVGVIGRCVVRR